MTGTCEQQVSTPKATEDDDYADVVALVEDLRAASPDSPEFVSLREHIVRRCLPLADHVAARYRNRGQEMEDLVQVARVGLVNAVNRFDPSRGSPFVAFAVPTIIGEVRRYFRDRTWMMSVPRRIKDLHSEAASAMSELTHTLGRAPTAKEIGSYLGVGDEEVRDALMAYEARSLHSLDKPAAFYDDAPPLGESMGEEDPRFEAVTDREALRPLLGALPPREKTILMLRFFEGRTQSDIAGELGISQMHVSRLLQSTLTKLREQLA